MGILISDFDDTITRYDFFDLVRKRWPFPAQDDPWEKFVAGEITHFEALAEIFASIRTTEADLLELADSTELAPSFAKSVRVLQDHGWEVVIASKYIAFLSRLPYLSVPTSLSNDGFCSPQSSLTIAERRYPFAIGYAIRGHSRHGCLLGRPGNSLVFLGR
jgi:Iron-containing alcohol dehydrogenase